MYKEVTGNLITLALKGEFDVIGQGNNCWCVQGAGLAPQMVQAFGTDQFIMEGESYAGDINKLGTIDFETRIIKNGKALSPKGVPRPQGHSLTVCNCYTQFDLGRNHKKGKSAPIDYEAVRLCMRKINYIFKGKTVGLPKIGSDLAGGIWDITQLSKEEISEIEFDLNDFKDLKTIIKEELTDCDVTVVIYDAPVVKPTGKIKLFKY